MASPRKPGFMLPVVVTLAVLLGLYVGAYYATVRPVSHPEFGTLATPLLPDEVSRAFFAMSVPEPHYTTPLGMFRRGGVLFAPIHWLDRRIRPHVWKLAE